MSCETIIAFITLGINTVGIFFSVLIYHHTVKKERKINTINEFSKIRDRFPNMSPLAKNPVSDEDRLEYLKEMERFSVGVNNKIYDLKILQKTSGHLLINQYNNYLRDLINNRRHKDSETWKYCEYEELISKLQNKLKIYDKNINNSNN